MRCIKEPLIFTPVYKDYLWGGSRIAEQFKRENTPDICAESWEISAHPDGMSIVTGGSFKGSSLDDLVKQFGTELTGTIAPQSDRFPLLFKIIDARSKLSVQVHPNNSNAHLTNGQPKTEMWYFLACDPGSRIYAGLSAGTTRAAFEEKLGRGEIEECLHVLPTREGDSIFIPSGRLHAIGEGNLIVEIQQNSDTTYRVFDWNRAGLDGKPRALHLEESMLSTDFEDFAPALAHVDAGVIAECEHFRVEKKNLGGATDLRPPGSFALVTVIDGRAVCGSGIFGRGDFFLLPADNAPPVAPDGESCAVLISTIP